MKKCLVVLAALTLSMAMGITVWAKEEGEKEQSAKIWDIFGERISEKSTDLADFFSEELKDEDTVKLAEEVIAFIREKLDAGELETQEDVAGAIEEGEEEFGVDLTEEEKEKILQATQKIKDLGLDPEKLLDQAQKVCEDAGEKVAAKAKESVRQTIAKSFTGFFQDMGTRVKGFFAGVF